MPTREAIFSALFALVSTGEGLAGTLAWGDGQGLAYTSRRVRLWGDIPVQPALCQAEHDETVTEATGLPSKTTLSASWLIYHEAAKDPAAVPTTQTNQILDAVQALFPAGDPDNVQTLGGLVHHAFINGKVFKDSGDLDGQALIIVPITLLIP
jgi:hypothetical protein